MSLSNIRPDFHECPRCAEKPGSPALCRECLERRELYWVLQMAQDCNDRYVSEESEICPYCNGTPNPNCPEHGR